MKACVLGSPVSQSLSPAIFVWLSRKTSRPLSYSAMDTPASKWSQTLELLRRDQDCVGANVTIPLKELAFQSMDHCSDSARSIGAVNVIQRLGSQLQGHNTDIIGIKKVLESQDQFQPAELTVIAGTGGSARAAVFALKEMGCSTLQILSRDPKRAKSFCESIKASGISLLPWNPQSQPRTWINATPAGHIPPQQMASIRLVFDFAYRPHPTPMVRDSLKHGCAAVTGLSMLIWQALATWKIWFSEDVLTKSFHDELLQELKSQIGEVA